MSSLKRKLGVVVGAWAAVSVVASAAMVRAAYVTFATLQGEEYLNLEHVPPETWAHGDTVKNVKTGALVRVWGIGSEFDWFMDAAGTLHDTEDFVLVELNEEEA